MWTLDSPPLERIRQRYGVELTPEWLNHLRHRHPQAQTAFDDLRVSNDPSHIDAWLALHAPVPHRLPGEGLSMTQIGFPAAPAEIAQA